MIPRRAPSRRAHRPHLRRLAGALALLLLVGWATDAAAERKRRRKRGRKKPVVERPAARDASGPADAPSPGVDVPGAAPAGSDDAGATGATGAPAGAGARKGAAKGKDQIFDFTGLELAGSMRMPQLLYFLDRAEEELERASLQRRSFVPELIRSVEEEAL